MFSSETVVHVLVREDYFVADVADVANYIHPTTFVQRITLFDKSMVWKVEIANVFSTIPTLSFFLLFIHYHFSTIPTL